MPPAALIRAAENGVSGLLVRKADNLPCHLEPNSFYATQARLSRLQITHIPKPLALLARPYGPRSHDSFEPQPLFRRSRSQLRPEFAGGNRHLVKVARHRALYPTATTEFRRADESISFCWRPTR